ncbi:transcriptional regulator [Luteimicrobium album]|uniref:Transcriptional regulator n=1 Tax=Luteimicrobium album TaxID=1054550 RepID=A0ABQ6HXF1_9MICO|nr:LCP family protein [Luteimicrobium album]GMA23171.1 transcriptional regulator [Luteimicrobium album]
MTTATPPASDDGPARPPAHARAAHTHRLVKVVALVVVGAVAAVGSGAWALARHYQGNVTGVNVEAVLGKPTHTPDDPNDPDAGHDLNILVLGSDSRAGDNAEEVGDGEKGQRSDTAMILHLSADRKRIEVVSIPRDSIVDIPACKVDTKGTTTRATHADMFNNAFAYGADATGSIAGGALCTWQTVEQDTGLHLDGFVVVDFAGFAGMIDALDGVPMCITRHIDSPNANHLVLDPGWQTLKGKKALGYARAREGKGLDGSDTSRILRQQEMVGAMVNKLVDQNVLTSAPKLLNFLDAATKSLTTSSNLSSLKNLVGLGWSVRHLSPDDVVFLTIPYEQYPLNHNRVQWAPSATGVWKKLKEDKPLVASETKGSSTHSSASSTSGSTTPSTKTPSTKMPTAPATPKNRATDGIDASEIPSTKAACEAAITAAQS